MRHSWISRFIVLVVAFGAGIAWAGEKKGVGLYDLHAPERIAALNVAWYYTWGLDPIEGAPQKKFVPMLFGGHRLQEQINTVQARGKVPILLAINEPDVRNQANMSVQEAVRHWTKISSLTDRLSSPAPAAVLSPWFDKFYRMTKTRGLKVDFMAVHLYGPPDAEKFLKKIDAVYEKYRMPIWITEFAVADWDAAQWNCKASCKNRYSEAEVLTFMKTVLPELEKRQFVVRYAWFGAGNFSLTHEQVRSSRLFEKDGSLTTLGRYYAGFE